jgi:hypothetical protein
MFRRITTYVIPVFMALTSLSCGASGGANDVTVDESADDVAPVSDKQHRPFGPELAAVDPTTLLTGDTPPVGAWRLEASVGQQVKGQLCLSLHRLADGSGGSLCVMPKDMVALGTGVVVWPSDVTGVQQPSLGHLLGISTASPDRITVRSANGAVDSRAIGHAAFGQTKFFVVPVDLGAGQLDVEARSANGSLIQTESIEQPAPPGATG